MAYLNPSALISAIANGAELIDGTVTIPDGPTYSMGPRVYTMLSPPCYPESQDGIVLAHTVRGQFKADLDGDVVTLGDP